MLNAYNILIRILFIAVVLLSIAIGIKEYNIMRVPQRTEELLRALSFYASNLSASASLKDYYVSDDNIVYANIQVQTNEDENIKILERKLLNIGFSEKKPSPPRKYFTIAVNSKSFSIKRSKIASICVSERQLEYSMQIDNASYYTPYKYILQENDKYFKIIPISNNMRVRIGKYISGDKEKWISQLLSSFKLRGSTEKGQQVLVEKGKFDIDEVKKLSQKRIANIKKVQEREQEKEKNITKFKSFYDGQWLGTYTQDGKESERLSIDLLRTYTKASDKPHLRGVLRLSYGTFAKVNLEGSLQEDGKLELSDSNYITWECAPYYDGSKRIAGTFKGQMDGKVFEGKWFAEKKKETSNFKLLSKKEERKSIESLIIGEWKSDWYGSLLECPTKFSSNGSFYVKNSRKSEKEVGTYKIIDSKTFELSISREKILYKVKRIDNEEFEFQAQKRNWPAWKGKR